MCKSRLKKTLSRNSGFEWKFWRVQWDFYSVLPQRFYQVGDVGHIDVNSLDACDLYEGI